jgi:hypothetical protein
MSPNQLLPLAVFLIMAATAFRQLRPEEPPVRFFSLKSVPFAFLFWIALTLGAWAALSRPDIQNTRGFVLAGIIETALGLIASIYIIVCLVRRR